MKRLWAMAALLLCVFSAGALAQEKLTVHVAAGALEEDKAGHVLALLQEKLPHAEWTLDMEEKTGESLRDLVLSGREPALAICAPGQALPYAREGMLRPLQRRVGSMLRVQRQVLDGCVLDEDLFMAPLLARHRQMAVNVHAFERLRLSYLLDERAHPVWYPTQMYQILEEFMIADKPALEIWPAVPGESAAIEALVQAIYGGALLSEDGERCQAASPEMIAGTAWLCESVKAGMIAAGENREAALARFVSGETAMFLDWSEEEAARQKAALSQSGVQVIAVPYPSALSLPVRAFETIGVCAFESGDAASDAWAAQGAALLFEDAQEIFGERAIWQDDAIWLPSLDADDRGATLRSLFCRAFARVMAGETDAQAALAHVQSAMDALD